MLTTACCLFGFFVQGRICATVLCKDQYFRLASRSLDHGLDPKIYTSIVPCWTGWERAVCLHTCVDEWQVFICCLLVGREKANISVFKSARVSVTNGSTAPSLPKLTCNMWMGLKREKRWPVAAQCILSHPLVESLCFYYKCDWQPREPCEHPGSVNGMYGSPSWSLQSFARQQGKGEMTARENSVDWRFASPLRRRGSSRECQQWRAYVKVAILRLIIQPVIVYGCVLQAMSAPTIVGACLSCVTHVGDVRRWRYRR